MTNALRSIAFASIALGLAAGASAAPVTEQRSVGAFTAIEAGGPYDFKIAALGPQALTLSGEANDLAEIETFLRGSTLVVRARERNGFHFNFNKRNHPTVTIGAPALNMVRANGSGDVSVTQVSGEQFELRAEGPGKVRIAGAVRALTLNSSGPGDVDATGFKAVNAQLNVSGPGDVRIGSIGGGAITANVSGPGDLVLDSIAAASTDAHLSGPGGLRVKGSSTSLRVQVDGPGDFEGCGLAAQKVEVTLRGPGDGCVGGTIRELNAESWGPGDLTVRGLDAQQSRVRLHGPGNVVLEGRTGQLNAEVSGPGDLEGRKLNAARAEVAVHGPGNAQLLVNARLTTYDRRGMRTE